MGSPKRNRSKFEKPKERWSLERIKADNSLVTEFGLKNMSELWKVQTEVSRIRRNARELLSGSGSEDVKESMIGRLQRLGIVSTSATLDNLLDLKENDILNRRLQTVVYRRGMARSMKQARQLTVHGFISINGRKVNRPGYMVDIESEKALGYYKGIDIAPPKPASEDAPQVGAASEGEQATSAPAQEAAAPAQQGGESHDA